MTDTHHEAHEPASQDNASEESTSSHSASEDQWNQVGGDFQKLGQSIATAITGLWNDDKNREQLTEIQSGLSNMAEQVTGAVNEAISSDTSQDVKTGVNKAVDEAKEAGGKIYSDSRPFVIGALKKMNESLQTIIDRLDVTPTENSEEEAETSEEA